MSNYLVTQEPGKALKVIGELNELIDGNVAISSKENRLKGDMATAKFTEVLNAMDKPEVLALLTSLGALSIITRHLTARSVEYIEENWGQLTGISIADWDDGK